jgi:catechol 2,3-dioxygenase-like lactoylglutathione lyase family enzyme
MLSHRDAVANVAVKDLGVAREFYERVLGLEAQSEQDGEVVIFKTGHTQLNVYRSQFAGTNKATAVTWSVGDELEAQVRELKDKGVKFEHYDLPGMERKGDIHSAGAMKVAWFKDPDGNILNLINQ